MIIQQSFQNTCVLKEIQAREEIDTGMGVRRGCQGDLIPLDFEI